MKNRKYGLHGKLKAKAGQGEALAKILLEAAELMKTAPGCELYVVSLDANISDEVWITEIWDNENSHDESLNLNGVRALIGQAMPLLDGSPEGGQKLVVLGGHS